MPEAIPRGVREFQGVGVASYDSATRKKVAGPSGKAKILYYEDVEADGSQRRLGFRAASASSNRPTGVVWGALRTRSG